MPRGVLTILHFNDVYEIAQRSIEPVGGAPRFAHMCARLRAQALEPQACTQRDDATALGPVDDGSAAVVLFSGDALSPSLMSTVTKGKHMIPVLNAIAPAAAVLGNHEGDHGFDNFERIAAQHTFPWLVSNARLKHDGMPLGHCQEYAVFQAGSWKIGCMGLIEREWLETLATLNPDAVEYEDFIDSARRMNQILREEHGCDLVIALTHMRVPNDLRLAKSGVPLDFILGGHDHDYFISIDAEDGSVPVIKSACDFRTLSRIRISATPLSAGAIRPEDARIASQTGHTAPPRHRFHVDVTRYEVTNAEPEDASLRAAVNEYADVLGRKMEAVIGVTRVPLQIRFADVRTKETNVGDFVADLMRQAMDADIALLNGGTLRTDAVVGPGILRMKDLVTMLPMQDPTVKLRVPGRIVLAALENSVSAWPKMEGRFCQVSGVKFAFDPTKPPGHRVIRDTVMLQVRPHGQTPPYGVSPRDDGFVHAVDDAQLSPHDDSGSESDALHPMGAAATAWAFGAGGGVSVDLQPFFGHQDVPADLSADGKHEALPPLHIHASHAHGTSAAHNSHDAFHTSGQEHAQARLHRAESAPDIHVAQETDAHPVRRAASTSDYSTEPPATISTTTGVEATVVTPHGTAVHRSGVSMTAPTWAPLDLEASYTVATKSYLAIGKDGFDCFLDPAVQTLIGDEEGPILPTIVRNHFRILAALSGFGTMDTHHPLSLTKCRRSKPTTTHVCRTIADPGSAPADLRTEGHTPHAHAHAHAASMPEEALHTRHYDPTSLRVSSPVAPPTGASDLDPHARTAALVAEAAARVPVPTSPMVVADVSSPAARAAPASVMAKLQQVTATHSPADAVTLVPMAASASKATMACAPLHAVTATGTTPRSADPFPRASATQRLRQHVEGMRYALAIAPRTDGRIAVVGGPSV